MKAIVLITVLLTISISVSGQKFTIEDIQLRWEDFTTVDGSRPFSAKIATPVIYRWKTKQDTNGGTLLSFKSEVQVDHARSWVQKEFLNQSWSIKQEVLNHEKGHLLIAIIHHHKLQQMISNYKFSKNPKREIDSLYKIVRGSLDMENEKYDNKTNHYINKEKQKEWT